MFFVGFSECLLSGPPSFFWGVVDILRQMLLDPRHCWWQLSGAFSCILEGLFCQCAKKRWAKGTSLGTCFVFVSSFRRLTYPVSKWITRLISENWSLRRSTCAFQNIRLCHHRRFGHVNAARYRHPHSSWSWHPPPPPVSLVAVSSHGNNFPWNDKPDEARWNQMKPDPACCYENLRSMVYNGLHLLIHSHDYFLCKVKVREMARQMIPIQTGDVCWMAAETCSEWRLLRLSHQANPGCFQCKWCNAKNTCNKNINIRQYVHHVHGYHVLYNNYKQFLAPFPRFCILCLPFFESTFSGMGAQTIAFVPLPCQHRRRQCRTSPECQKLCQVERQNICPKRMSAGMPDEMPERLQREGW